MDHTGGWKQREKYIGKNWVDQAWLIGDGINSIGTNGEFWEFAW
jgi:hypothetical protein